MVAESATVEAMATARRRPIIRATSGSVLGMEGRVEKVLSSIRQKSDRLKCSQVLQKLTEVSLFLPSLCND